MQLRTYITPFVSQEEIPPEVKQEIYQENNDFSKSATDLNDRLSSKNKSLS